MTVGSVVDAGDLFAARHFPVNSLVSHPTHGFGYIRERNGDQRLVAFQNEVCKTLDQLPREEWPDENPLNVRFVKALEISSVWVPAAELNLLAPPSMSVTFSPRLR